MTDEKPITKAERAELRSVVKGQFKVLRTEVKQRAAELSEEARGEVVDKYAEIDAARAAVEGLCRDIVRKASDEVFATINAHAEKTKPKPHQHEVTWPGIDWQPDSRYDLAGQASAEIASRMMAALTTLDRKEADLLRDLSIDALETSAAHAWLTNIPTAAELVPATRMAELEARLGEVDPDDPRWRHRRRGIGGL